MCRCADFRCADFLNILDDIRFTKFLNGEALNETIKNKISELNFVNLF